MVDKDKIIKNLKDKISELEDEVESLWEMMDELKNSNPDNFMHLIETVKTDIIANALLKSENKNEA